MNNFLLWIGGLVTICLGALFAGPHFVDWTGYRGVIEEEASRYFGRRVRIGGEVNVRILPVPYVSFDKLSISDTSGTFNGPIIRADNFKMWLSVPPMLQGVLEAHHVELRRPVINLVVNDSGGGNWQSLQLKPGSMSYMPGGFALEGMDIIDGEVHLRNPSGAVLTRVDAINGKLSATALKGPYKFNGGFKWRGDERTLRLATGRPSTNGDVRLKASISKPDAPRRARGLVLDGVMATHDGKASFEGTVVARISGVAPPQVPGSKGAPKSASQKATSTFDLRSGLTVNTKALELTGINLALETDGPPQLMTGNASLDWRDEVALDVDLNSRWLDFDRFTSSASDAPPLDNARQLLVGLGRSLPQAAKTNVHITFDQATLGGEALGKIALVAVREKGPLKLKEFEASVPGGGKLALSGELSVAKTVPGFRGRVSAQGQSLLKFLRWGLRDGDFATDVKDGPYSIDGELSLAENSFSISDAAVDFGETPLKSDLAVEFAPRAKIALSLDGHTLDWRRFSPKAMNVDLARALMAAADAGKSEGNQGDAPSVTPQKARVKTLSSLGADVDLKLSVKAANLMDGDNTFREFDGTIVVNSGKVSVPVLRFARDSGFALDIEADAGGAGAKEAGDKKDRHAIIRGLVVAKSHIAMTDLLAFLGASDLDPNVRQRLAALTPLRVANVTRFGKANNSATTMRFDGLSRGGQLVADIAFVDGLSGWQDAPLRFNARIENQNARQLFSLLADSRTFSRAQAMPRQPGLLLVKADGVPSKGVLTRAVIESQDLNLNYYGDVALEAGHPFAIDGGVEIESQSARDAMAVVGVELGDGVAGVPIKGRFKVVRRDATLRLRADDVAMNSSRVSGLISLTEQENAPSKLVANLKVDQATLPGIMRAILAPETIKATDAQPAGPGGQIRRANLVQKVAVTSDDASEASAQHTRSIWPKQHFDLGALTNIEGYISADFDTFAFAKDGGLPLSKARLEASVTPGTLSVTKLTGTALGGQTDVKFDIKKAPAGVDLNGTLQMRVGKLSKQSAGSEKAAKGAPVGKDDAAAYAAVFDLTYEGRAFAPQGLAADLDGTGKLVLADASLTGLTAKEVRISVDEAMKAEGPVDSATFVSSLKDKLKQGQIELGSLSIPVALKDGAVSISTINVDGADGKTSFDASLEVASMRFDSEWKIAARDPVAAKTDTSDTSRLPAVTATYVGDLSALATVEPRLSTGALEREIAVRKMERDVAELERLRKLDEERAKEEQERRRALEARLAEQRRQQAERERQLLLEQQRREQLGPDGLAMPQGAPGGDPSLQDPNAAPVAEAPKPRVRRRRRPRRPPPKKDVWNPFQITPY